MDVAANPDRPRSRFFVWSAVVMLVVIALGFGKSFFLRPAFNDKPLPLYLLIHGATMTVWYLLFLTQAALIGAHRIRLHRQLGIAGVALAAAVVVTGVVVQLNVIPRLQASGEIATPEDLSRFVGFVLSGLSTLLAFAVLIGLAVFWRRNAGVHKRLMFWAVVWTLGPAFTNNRPLGAFLDPLVAPVLPFFPADLLWFVALLAYDWKTARRIHPATWLGFLGLAIFFLFVTDWIVGIGALQDWLKASV